MAEYYFINQKIVTLDNNISLGTIDSNNELEPINLLKGKKLSPEPKYINIELSDNSGNFYPDIISVPITLYSDKIKNCLDECEVNNIDYYPVKILDKKTNSVNTKYWFAHIRGRIPCLDIENSDTEIDIFGDGVDFKSFSIDESKTRGLQIFRLDELGRLVIINQRIYSALVALRLKGVIMKNTRDYDGHGM